MPAAELAAILPRAALDVAAALTAIEPVCEDVRRRGSAAVREYTAKFDGVDLPATTVPSEALVSALEQLEPAVRAALTEAARRARLVHKAQLPAETWTAVAAGSTVTERYLPVRRAGVYVPGGLVAYPSSVLMNVIPAQVAGVAEIAVASPPQPEHGGLPHPAILAACALLGITEVHAAGGAQAIAMLGYGTQDCAPVDVITGPGNVYVAAAKRLLRNWVAIDAEAGPTEIAIIADDGADASFIAADLVAQAEHDPMAACLLITTSAALADRVEIELAKAAAQARSWSTMRMRRWPWPMPGHRSTWRSRPRTPRSWPAGCATPGPSSWARGRRCHWVITWPGPITCCRPAGPPGTPAACRR
jgi:histidinol dehydrogenase